MKNKTFKKLRLMYGDSVVKHINDPSLEIQMDFILNDKAHMLNTINDDLHLSLYKLNKQTYMEYMGFDKKIHLVLESLF